MTDEAKKNLLDYMLGKMPSDSGVEEEIFQSINETDRSVWEPFLPSSWNNFYIEGIISPNETSTSLGIMYGGYIVRKENNLFATIISTGSEVELSIKIADYLYENYKIDIRVVSMPNRELFLKQSKEYQENIIPKGYRTIVIEAGSKYGWEGFVYNDKYLITLDKFGCSGTMDEVLNEMDFSYDKILQKIIKLLK